MIADPFADLTPREWSVLDMLQGAERPLAAVAFVEELNAAKSSVYHALSRLLALGLVEKQRDGIRNCYRATALGLAKAWVDADPSAVSPADDDAPPQRDPWQAAIDAARAKVAEARAERDDLAAELVEIADLVGAADHEEVVAKVRALLRRAEAPLPRLRDVVVERLVGWLL